MTEIRIIPVATAADRRAYVDLPWQLYRHDPSWIPPLKGEVHGLLNRKGNPYFGHARAQEWLALKSGAPVGRISAQICDLVQQQTVPGTGPGTGQFGFFEAVDDMEVVQALFTTAEGWLRDQGMVRVLGPFSYGIWDEAGLLVDGFDTAPRVMMAHALPRYAGQLAQLGYTKSIDLYAYDLNITHGFPERINRIIAAGEKNPRIRLRQPDKSNYLNEVRLILEILNDAWSDNWGFVPITDPEVDFAARKLKPIVYPDIIRICEYDGEPVGFMLTLPNINELTADLDGRLFPFGWAKLLWRLRTPQVRYMRVPLMGLRKSFQASRHGALMIYMMFEHIRRVSVDRYGATNGELSWVLETNNAMNGISESLGAPIAKTYRVFEKAL